ncbi:hypothetical protein ACTFIW_003195 [Dictyostelium discoideum]
MLSINNKIKNLKLSTVKNIYNKSSSSSLSIILVNNNNNNKNYNNNNNFISLSTTNLFNQKLCIESYKKVNYCKKKGGDNKNNDDNDNERNEKNEKKVKNEKKEKNEKNDVNEKVEIIEKDNDLIVPLSKELLQFDKPSNKRKDWPLNSEVVIYPSNSVNFIGTTGPINLGFQFITRLVPNASGKTFVGFFLCKDGYRNNSNQIGRTMDSIHNVGVLAQITLSPNGIYHFETIKRIRIKEVQNGQFPFIASIEPLSNDERELKDPRIAELMTKINVLSLEYKKLYPDVYTINSVDFENQIEVIDNPDYYLAAVINYYGLNYPDECQKILETQSVVKRLEMLYHMILNEQPLLALQQKIAKDLDDKTTAYKNKLLLTEQLKKLKALLGNETDEKEKTIEKYQNKLSELTLISESSKKVIQDEIYKISTIDPSSSEYSALKNYLEWLTNLPWGIYSADYFDLKHSKMVLDSDHYGLEDIKQRILEFISVGHIKGTVQGKILCFIGPPGTGKTSIAKSIAKALKKEFFRFSVGGLFDESEIKGHRRTYVGSMPGKIIQALKITQTSNPVILIDEIDKIGKRNHGDPSSALLEVLDPEQNVSFVDHYLDTPYDLSKVLFICTANSGQDIPAALSDRMEIIRLPGYVEEEQIEIVKNFIIPKTFIDCGIKLDQLSISDDVIKQIVKFYSREVGIRELEKLIEKIMRKTALKLVNGTAERVDLTLDNLEQYLGIPSYTSDRYYDVTPIGVVNGLAYTKKGGATLYIESTSEEIQKPLSSLPPPPSPSQQQNQLEPSIKTTGNLGDVMSESSTIAYTFAKNFLYELDPNNTFFSNHNIHLHSPQGNIPKDGPSAGVTMVTSLLSLALNEPVQNNLGMTGEITITGKVITIGGVKEKTIAAKRSGLTSVIFPINNRINFEELPTYIKNDIDVTYANDYKDVFEVAFPNKKYLLNNLKTF